MSILTFFTFPCNFYTVLCVGMSNVHLHSHNIETACWNKVNHVWFFFRKTAKNVIKIRFILKPAFFYCSPLLQNHNMQQNKILQMVLFFLQRIIRKTLYICKLLRNNDVKSSWKSAFVGKCNIQVSCGLCRCWLIWNRYRVHTVVPLPRKKHHFHQVYSTVGWFNSWHKSKNFHLLRMSSHLNSI